MYKTKCGCRRVFLFPRVFLVLFWLLKKQKQNTKRSSQDLLSKAFHEEAMLLKLKAELQRLQAVQATAVGAGVCGGGGGNLDWLLVREVNAGFGLVE